MIDHHVAIELPDLAAARACHHTPEYAAARCQREGACIAHVCIVDVI